MQFRCLGTVDKSLCVIRKKELKVEPTKVFFNTSDFYSCTKTRGAGESHNRCIERTDVRWREEEGAGRRGDQHRAQKEN